jgi:DHA2 family methylenomycin A resistance protein-like MFS transporter
MTLAVTGVAFFMVLLDTTIVTVALPSVQRDLHVGLGALGAVVTGYTLPFAALLLPSGTLGDRFGRRRLFLVGLVLFTAGSGLCALAPGLAVLVAGRAVQGIGGAALGPASLALVATAFPDERARARALGTWSAVTGSALAAGPLAGGLLLRATGDWRSVFAVNLPVGVVAWVLARRALTEQASVGGARLDRVGALLAVGALTPLVWALSQSGNRGWTDAAVLACLVAAGLLLVGFVIHEARADPPMLPLTLFRDRLFTGATVVALAVGAVLTSNTFFVAQYFQDVQQLDPLGSGLRSLPSTVAIAATAPIAGRLTARHGYRLPVTLGTVIGAVALVALLRLRPDTPYADIWWNLAALGVGFGLTLSPLVAAVLTAAPRRLSGIASGVNNVARQLGGTLAVAALTAVATSRTAHALPALLPPTAHDIDTDALARAGAAAARAPDGVGPAVGAAFVDALHTVFAANAALLLLAAATSALLLNRRTGSLPDTGAARAVPSTEGAHP